MAALAEFILLFSLVRLLLLPLFHLRRSCVYLLNLTNKIFKPNMIKIGNQADNTNDVGYKVFKYGYCCKDLVATERKWAVSLMALWVHNDTKSTGRIVGFHFLCQYCTDTINVLHNL